MQSEMSTERDNSTHCIGHENLIIQPSLDMTNTWNKTENNTFELKHNGKINTVIAA